VCEGKVRWGSFAGCFFCFDVGLSLFSDNEIGLKRVYGEKSINSRDNRSR